MARAWVQAVRKRVKETKSVSYTRYTLGSNEEATTEYWPDMSQVVLPEEEAPESKVSNATETKFFNVVLSLSVDEAAVINRALVVLAYSIEPQKMADRLEVTPLQNELAKAVNKARAAEAELEGPGGTGDVGWSSEDDRN